MRWPTLEDILIYAVILIAVVVMFWVLTGCTQSQKLSDYDVLWSDGKCIFHAKGMTVEQAQQLEKYWDFENCAADIDIINRKEKRHAEKESQ